MARAAIGLAQDTGRDHPVCASLGKLADTVRASLETNESDLSQPIDELDTLITERDQSIQTLAQPYIQLVSEHEIREASLASAQDWLLKARGKITRPEIGRFLSDYWLRVMQAAHAEGGATGARWKECEATIDELLWSVTPKQTAEERKQLLTLIPSLLKRVNAGLDRAGISTEERTPFLNFCFELQSAALRSRPESPDTLAVEPVGPSLVPDSLRPASLSPESSVQVLERNGKLVQYFGQPTTTPSPWRNSGSSLWKEGDWISFHLPDGEHLSGRHCWKGTPTGTVLLFNTDWGFAVAFTPSMLEQQLRDERAHILSDASLFDDAAQKALGQITSL